MAKMNWDRVRDWDRVRGDLSEMERADERDERWFDSEREREERRADGRAGQHANKRNPAAPVPSKAKRASKRASAAVKKSPLHGLGAAALARELDVTKEQLTAARRAESTASSGLEGLSPATRRERTAARLKITATELKLLRQALGGSLTSSPQRVRMLVLQVGGFDVTQSPARTPKAAKSARKGSRPGSASSPAPKGRHVYVTPWGNVVHLYNDCHSARGFRHAGEPDPPIYRVPESDPCCRGRRVCGTCANHDSATGQQVERQLRKLHGKAFDERDWERYGWSRPLPKGQPINTRRGK